MEAITAIDTPSRDLDLAERHRHGDPGAFDEVYERFSSMVYGLAYRMAGKAEEAEDLTQEIFVRIFRHLGRFNGRSALKTWIYRITLNHCRSRLSRRRWLMRPIVEEGGEEEQGVQLVDERRGPESRALADDASRQIHRALTRVKPVFKEAVVLRDLEGLSYEEIAEILSIRIGTVRSRIARGREQLRLAVEKMP